MIIRELLSAVGIRIGPKRRYNWKTRDYEEIAGAPETIYNSNMYVAEKTLLTTHLDDEVLDFSMFGKVTCFAFKLRGSNMAIYNINNIETPG